MVGQVPGDRRDRGHVLVTGGDHRGARSDLAVGRLQDIPGRETGDLGVFL
jgi:hypothetical protein